MNATAIRIVSIVFGLASTVIIVLNLLTDRSSFWAIWPIWAVSMLAGVAIGAIRFHPNWLLGPWLGGGFLLIAGLVAIDISDGRNWWAFLARRSLGAAQRAVRRTHGRSPRYDPDSSASRKPRPATLGGDDSRVVPPGSSPTRRKNCLSSFL